MKILHMCESLARGGGIASFVSDVTCVQSLQHDVTIGLINKQPNECRVDIAKDVEVLEFGKSKAGFSIKYPIRIYKYISRVKPEIVHIHSSFLYYALSVILLHNSIKFVYTIHSDAVQENASKWDRMFFGIKKMCFRLGWIHPVTISKASKKSFDELYGMDSKLIINGVKQREISGSTHELDKYRYTDKTKIFYHPGRITEAKNQRMLCEAFRHLILSGEDVVLLISGTKQDESIYKELSQYFSDRIIYLGERDDVLDLLSESDVMCLSSIWEGLPIVLLESLTVGCIPVCTPVGGIPEVIKDGVNGILSKGIELQAYIDALYRYLLMSQLKIDKMKMQVLSSAQEFNIAKTASIYCEYYSHLLNKEK